eukprot:1156546-Pelagomonas_calceolata.AAC.2
MGTRMQTHCPVELLLLRIEALPHMGSCIPGKPALGTATAPHIAQVHLAQMHMTRMLPHSSLALNTFALKRTSVDLPASLTV